MEIKINNPGLVRPREKRVWEEDHGRFIGVSYAEFALFKDVTVINTVVDGVGLESNKIAVIANSKASGGAPLKYSEVQEQGTYFKCTRSNSQAFYCININCTGGSIGVHYSTSNGTASDNSLTVLKNCHFYNQSQDAIHFEDCKRIFLYKVTVGRDTNSKYQADVHVSNAAIIASIKSCEFKNARIDFNNASSLKLGIIDSCQFVSEFKSSKTGINTFIEGRPTICIHSTFAGRVSDQQAALKNVRKCTFKDFDALAVLGGYATDGCTFINGVRPVSTINGGFVINCTFKNVKDPLYKNKPYNDDWKKIYLSIITILSNTNKYLGRITCGATTQEATSNITSNNVAEAIKSSDNNNNDILKSQPINLYPNPATDILHVTLNEKISGKILLNIYDQQGRLVQTKTFYKNTSAALVETINVKALSPGLYVLQIVNEREKSSLKFVIEK